MLSIFEVLSVINTLLFRKAFCTILVLADPPSESPQITRHAAAGELLRTGDTVTCTVTGGRPTVDEVIFYCTDPQLDGHPGDVNATSVSSTITVDSARATEDNMTCFCSAVWKPNEDYYHLASEATYIIERKILSVSVTAHLFFLKYLNIIDSGSHTSLFQRPCTAPKVRIFSSE